MEVTGCPLKTVSIARLKSLNKMTKYVLETRDYVPRKIFPILALSNIKIKKRPSCDRHITAWP